MSALLEEAPLSVLRSIKSATKLYFVTAKEILPLGVFCTFLGVVIELMLAGLSEPVEGSIPTLLDIFKEFIVLLAIGLPGIFLLLSVAYTLKVFVEKLPVTRTMILKKALIKMLPTCVTALFLAITFGVVAGGTAILWNLLFATITDWHALGNQILGTVMIVAATAFYIVIFSYLLKASLYGFPIIFEDKGMWAAIQYSMTLVRGWRRILGTFFLFFFIQVVSIFSTVYLTRVLGFHSWGYFVFSFLIASVVFPWCITCMVTWYWHLEKRGWESV